MGTNYYWSEKPACPTCGHVAKPRHIGKSSAGWVFALHVYPTEGINDLKDWKRCWTDGGKIRDEYGRPVSIEEMHKVIANRKREERWDKAPFMYQTWEEFHRANGSERGPAGLVRGKLDQRCIKHGSGTWDCYIGDFS